LEINIYGRPNCQKCHASTDFLKRRGWNYTYHNLMEMDLQAAKNILDESGMQSIPIVKIDNIYIGGYDQLEAYINGVEQRAM